MTKWMKIVGVVVAILVVAIFAVGFASGPKYPPPPGPNDSVIFDLDELLSQMTPKQRDRFLHQLEDAFQDDGTLTTTSPPAP